jgi:hypothetical protein
LRTATPQTELESLLLYLPIPAVDANPTAKRDHPIANEARYRHYNQGFINADNWTIGHPLLAGPAAIYPDFCGEIATASETVSP